MDCQNKFESFENFVTDLEPSIKTFRNRFSFKLCEEILNKIINEFSNEVICLFIQKYPNFIFTVDIIDLKNKIKHIIKNYSLNHFTDFLTQELTEKLFKFLCDQNLSCKYNNHDFETYEKNKIFLHEKPIKTTKNEKIVYENLFLDESSEHSFAEIQDKNSEDNIILNDCCLSQEFDTPCNESFDEIKFKNFDNQDLKLFFEDSENILETESVTTSLPSSYYLIEVSVSSLYDENNSYPSSTSSSVFDQEKINNQIQSYTNLNFEDERKFIENLYCEETMESNILELSKNIFDEEDDKENFSLNLKCINDKKLVKTSSMFSSKRTRGESFLSFPLKLYQLINASSDAIKWNSTGEIILINFNLLKEDPLYKKLFRSKKTNTFIRNLNSYGFKIERKNHESKNFTAYFNCHFKKGCEENLNLIKRKKIQKNRK